MASARMWFWPPSFGFMQFWCSFCPREVNGLGELPVLKRIVKRKTPRRRVILRRLPNWKQAIPARWLPLQRMLGDTLMINSPAFTSSGC